MSSLLNYGLVRSIIEKICFLFDFLNAILPKKKQILFFDSGEVYLNNYALFKKMLENSINERYKIYYSMPGIKSRFQTVPKNIFFTDNLIKTLFLYMTSKYVFIDIGSPRIKPSKHQMVINLWHGTPLKKIGFMSNTAEKDLPKTRMNAFSYVCVPSDVFKDIYIKSFNCNNKQLFLCGQIRNELLYSDKSLEGLGIKTQLYNHIIMWMTTYRLSKSGRLTHTNDKHWSSTNLPVLTDMEKLQEVNTVLAQNNDLMIIKIHHGSIFDSNSIKCLSNIILLDETDYIEQGYQLYEILAQCDSLITDYSSVYFDYLLLNRPIGFIIDDIEEYNRLNGFNFDNYLEWMPGEKMVSIDDIKRFVNNPYRNDFNEERIRINKLVNKYQDDCYTRILDCCGIEE